LAAQEEAMWDALDSAINNSTCNALVASMGLYLMNGLVGVSDGSASYYGFYDHINDVIGINPTIIGDERELGVTLLHEVYHALYPTHSDQAAEDAAQACFA
jgi:hypothetical protein